MLQRLGCNAELVVDEFGEKLLEELDYLQVRVCAHDERFGGGPAVHLDMPYAGLIGAPQQHMHLAYQRMPHTAHLSLLAVRLTAHASGE